MPASRRRVIALGLLAIPACGDRHRNAAPFTDVARTSWGGGEPSVAVPVDVPPTQPEAAKTEDIALTTKLADAPSEGVPADVPPSPPSVAMLADPETAIAVSGDGIVAFDINGQPLAKLSNTTPSWCRVDPRARALWMLDGSMLSVLDLERRSDPIVLLESAPSTIVISYGDEVLGQPEPHLFTEGLVVHMAEPVRLEAILGCDGELAFACFGDDFEDLDKAAAEKFASVRNDLAAALKVHPLPTTALAPLLERSRTPSVKPLAAPSATPQTVLISKKGCEEVPEDCGKASVLTGTPYWRVTVANSMGDFYHEEFRLYDPQTKEFFNPVQPVKRSNDPSTVEPFEPRWVSPSGKLMMSANALVSFERGQLVGELVESCGFVGGGWEIASH